MENYQSSSTLMYKLTTNHKLSLINQKLPILFDLHELIKNQLQSTNQLSETISFFRRQRTNKSIKNKVDRVYLFASKPIHQASIN